VYFVHLRTYRAAGNRVAAAGGDKQIQAKIVRYPYGSTQVQHTYNIVTNAPTTSTMAGISVRGNVLCTFILFSPFFPISPQLTRCL
jgi:hypothetical protein